MPETQIDTRYYPAISSLISPDDLPELLSFIKDGLHQIFDNVYYKDYQSSISIDGSSAFYSLSVVSRKKLALELPGTGIDFILNPDFSDDTISSFPISLFWDWQILKYVRYFEANKFSFSVENLFNLGLEVFNLTEEEVLSLAIVTFVIQSDPSISKLGQLVADINLLYGSNIVIDEYSENPIQDLIIQIKILNKEVYPTIFAIYLAGGDPAQLTDKLNYFFSSLLPGNLGDYIKELIISKARVTLELSAAIEFPRNVLLPMKMGDTGLVQDDTLDDAGQLKKSYFKFADALLGFDLQEGFSSEVELEGSLSPEFSQIGNTGLIIGFTGAKLDLSRTTNIPEADAAGFPVDFMGLYVKHATIGFNGFGKDNTEKVSALVSADNLLIGTGGISGILSLESNGLLHRKFGNFDVELNAFSLTFRQNSIVDSEIKGKLTIDRFKQGQEPAVINIQAHIQDNGDFSITVLPQEDDLFTITLPNVLEIHITSLALGKEDRGFYIEVAGKLDFIADIPVLGQVLPTGIDVKKLRIWDNGDLEFKGGGLVVPKAFRLNVGPVKLEVTNMSLGSTSRKLHEVERSYRFFGFDGMINLGTAGINATGNGIKFYFTSDDNDTDKPFNCFISIDGIDIDLTIPGNVDPASAAFFLKGHLSMSNPDPAISGSSAGSEYTGSVTFGMPRLKLAGSAAMRLNPGIPAFVVDIGLEPSAPIPLGATGLGIYGFRGLIGQHYLPSKSATTPPLADTASWWDYYKAKSTLTKQEGIEIDKFAVKPGYSVGAGVSIATAFDSGKIFSSKLFLLLGLPDVFLIQGQAGILRSRIGLDDHVDPPFSAFIAIDNSSFRGNLSVNYRLPEGGSFDGDVFTLNGTLDMAFFFNNASGWYLNVGKDQPESARVRAKILTLFQGYAYLMISSRGFKAGAGAKFDFNKSFGPVGVGIGANLDMGGSVSFSPVQIGAFIQFGGYAYIKVLFIKLGLSIQVTLAVEAPHPFNIAGGIELKINLPWPIKDIKFRLDVSWHFNNDNSVLLAPIPVLQLPDPAKGYIPAAATNILTNEIFPLNYVNHEITGGTVNIPAPADGSWQYNFNDPDAVMQVTIPLDSFIDIELLKPVKPGLLKLGGAANQLPDGYSELVPPQKGISNQVRHEYQLTGLDIFAWHDTGSGTGSWLPYNIYEAVTAIVLENTGDQATDLASLKEGYWQFTEPNKYSKIRLMSQNMFSYSKLSTDVSSDLDKLNFRRKDLFCFENITKENIIDWSSEDEGLVYPPGSSDVIKAVSLLYENLTGTTRFNPDNNNLSLRIETNGGRITIKLPQPVTLLTLEFGLTENDMRIDFVKTVAVPGPFGQTVMQDQYLTPSFVTKSQNYTNVYYNDLNNPIDKVFVVFTENKAIGFDGDLLIGGHRPLPDEYITLPRLLPHEEELSKALMFVTVFNRSFTPEEVLNGDYLTMPGAVGRWDMNSPADTVGNNNGILSGSPDLIEGYYQENGDQPRKLHDVYQFTGNNDALFVPFAPELEVESGNCSFEVTAVFEPFVAGISTLLYKVQEDPVTGYKSGFSMHLYQDKPGDSGTVYTDSASIPEFTVLIIYYKDLQSFPILVTEKYSIDCTTGKLLEKQYKHIFLSSNFDSSIVTVFIDRILKVTFGRPGTDQPATGPGITWFNKIRYLTTSQQTRQEENGITQDAMINEIELLNDSLNKTIQPVWRPDTTYAITVKTRDVVNGNTGGASEVSHIFGFRTAGPIGHFQQQSSIYKALAAEDRAAEFKLADLKDYIDYDRSSPDAKSRYDLSKPVFYHQPKVNLLFVQPYINAMYANWDNYLGLPAISSSLQIQVFDPFGVAVSPELNWEQLPDVIIDENNYTILPPDQQILFLMNQSGLQDSCNQKPITITKRTKRGAYLLPDLEPNRLYTALFNALYQPDGETAQKTEVHKFSFKTSRFVSFQEQAKSFILNETAGAEQYAVYPITVAFTDDEIERTLEKLVDDDPSNDPDSVMQYAVKYDRLVYGGLGLKNLVPVETTVIELIISINPGNVNDRRILGILIRNPEPFNDPKIPVELLGNTIQLLLTNEDGSITGPDQFTYIHSRDTSSVFITNGSLNILTGTMQLSFREKLFDGNDYETVHEDYTSPVIRISRDS